MTLHCLQAASFSEGLRLSEHSFLVAAVCVGDGVVISKAGKVGFGELKLLAVLNIKPLYL